MADTIMRTVELGVRIVDAALPGETTVLWRELLVDGPVAARDAGELSVNAMPIDAGPGLAAGPARAQRRQSPSAQKTDRSCR